MERNKSILQSDMSRCYVCGKEGHLHIHEVFYGTANRKKSIQYGCYVALCPEHHNRSSWGVHFNKTLDLRLKRECQKAFEGERGHDEFMRIFGRNYL